jgi:hypothetical protein
MNTHLNESHVCLIKNWSTFRKMKASADEVEEYIFGIVKNVFADIVRQHSSLLESDMSKLEKEHWLNIQPKSLVNFKQQGIVLFNFGIEGISLDEIFRTDAASSFQAYLYSPDRSQHPSIYSALDTLFQSITGPDEFVLNINKPEIGYYYTKKFSPLTVDKLPDIQFLTEYFREPLVSVIEWYNKYSKQILAIEPKRFPRV